MYLHKVVLNVDAYLGQVGVVVRTEGVEILGIELPMITIPVRPGRNLAIIIEVAARNFSLKKMGYSAAKELDRRLNEMMGLNMPK